MLAQSAKPLLGGTLLDSPAQDHSTLGLSVWAY